MKKPVAPIRNSPMNGERQQNETGNKIQIAHGAHFFFPALLNWPECTNQSQIMEKETKIICTCCCLPRTPITHLN